MDEQRVIFEGGTANGQVGEVEDITRPHRIYFETDGKRWYEQYMPVTGGRTEQHPEHGTVEVFLYMGGKDEES